MTNKDKTSKKPKTNNNNKPKFKNLKDNMR